MDLGRAGKPQKYFFKHFEDPAAKKYFEDSASTLVNHIPFKNSFQKNYCIQFQILISKTDLCKFGGLWEDAEENFAISADRQVEALAKFFTSTLAANIY